jgi:hypothetical protein
VTATASGHRNERGALKDGSSASQSGSSQEKTGPRSESSTNDEIKPNVEKGLEEVVVEQNRVLEAKVETRIEVGTSSPHPPNRTVWFPKPDHTVLAASG